MSRPPSPSPLYVDSFALCEWLLGHLGDVPRPLARSLCAHSLALLGAITLALKGRRRDEQLESADESLILLRTEIRLAAAVGDLTEPQMVFALEKADGIGRQLGGWLRSLGAV